MFKYIEKRPPIMRYRVHFEILDVYGQKLKRISHFKGNLINFKIILRKI